MSLEQFTIVYAVSNFTLNMESCIYFWSPGKVTCKLVKINTKVWPIIPDIIKKIMTETYFLRYLHNIEATFSQFFLVGQKIRQEYLGITSVTSAMMWSGSAFSRLLEYYQKHRLTNI